MSTTLNAGEDSIYIESQSPGIGWMRAKLNQIANTIDVNRDILDHTIKQSSDIWHSDKILTSINNKQIFEIPKNFVAEQEWFLVNETVRCYDTTTIHALLPKE